MKDKEPGTFVVRDSTTYRGSFGLAMKVDQAAAGSATADIGRFEAMWLFWDLFFKCNSCISVTST